MIEEKQTNKPDKYLTYFFIIVIALIVMVIVVPVFVNHFFSEWAKSGSETFGALNSLFSGFAFAGIIVTILIQKSELKNQRIELQLQRTEMQETRKEFLISRTTNFVYSQLDRFEKCVSELTITHNGKTFIGNDAISFLDENKATVYSPFDKPEEDFKREKRESIIKLLKIYSPNKSQIEKFAHTAYNSVEVLKRLIYKTDLEIEELNDIKNLFFVNIGFVNMGVIERISEVAREESKYIEIEDYEDNGIEVGQMNRANIFLKSINKFYHLRLNKENFAVLKNEWIKSIGTEV
jgi:hypothetical protein